MDKIKQFLSKNKIFTFALLIIIYFILIYIIDINLANINYTIIGAILIAGIILITNYIVIKQFKKEKKIDYKKIITAIIVVGVIVRTVYIMYTPITQRQHDTEGGTGHIAYIETIYETGKLPTTNEWQFYHQPLHHIIAAGWLKINDIFGVDLETSEEGIQILTAIYSSMIMLITYCILKELKIKDKFKILILIIAAIHPTFIILAGSINNDILMIMFTIWAILYLIKWYKNSNYKNTIILALLTAATALTKISGAIIAVPILYIFIDKVVKEYFKQGKDKKIIKKYTMQAVVFGIIALGFGLSYGIRNLMLFNQSIFYVPTPGTDLYCGDNSLFTRFNIFSSEWLDIFAHPYADCNMIVYLIKSSLFGEFHIEGTLSNIIAVIMLILNVLVIIISLISLVKILIKQERKDQILINMLAIFYIVEILVYAFGNLKMPYGCSMDIRYIVPTITLGSLFIAINMNDEKGKRFNKIATLAIVLFGIVSIIFELTYMEGIYIK